MSRILPVILVLASLLLVPASGLAQLVIDTVGVYDEEDFNDNTIDATAPGSIDVATFAANVLAAFQNDAGGVITFDDVPQMTGIDQIEAYFGVSHDKMLTLVNGDETTWWNDTGSGRTPISGDRVLGKHCASSVICTNDHIWEIESVSSGDVVLSMGVTVLSGLKGPFEITVEATLDDGNSVSLEEYLPQSDGLDDTFFAINAPPGRHITRFAVFNGPPYDEDPTNIGSFGSVDDLAFIVGPVGGGVSTLQAGDADQDLDFDQLDLVKVQIAAKYLTGQPATWGEGDWDAAPGGEPGNPPLGNGLFDQLDIIAALAPGHYLSGPYAALNRGGTEGDNQTSVIYNATTGEVGVDAPAGTELTSINIDSAAGIFTGTPAENLGGSFDNDADTNIFKATFGSSFGSLSFGNVSQPGLSEEFVLGDLTVVGSLAGGGDLGNVDLIYIPEPATALLAILGALAAVALRRRF